MAEDGYKTEVFQPAREYLLKFHDERELVIRLCRDINSYSKKMIFTLHRVQNEMTLELYEQLLANLKIISEKLSILYNKFLYNENFVQLKSTVSNSVEEMIEAFTFAYYIMNRDVLPYDKFSYVIRCLILSYNYKLNSFNTKLLNYALCELLFDVVENTITDEVEAPYDSVEFEVDFILPGDYLMGLFDLTGEIMRYSITHIVDERSKTVNLKSLENLTFMKNLNKHLKELFLKFPNVNINRGVFSTDRNYKAGSIMDKKLLTLQQSISKVETMICDMSIKGNEAVDYNDHNIYNY
ncbi:DEHA2G13090p [Debaryomyces hansenii CBS767]|uniref:DEHA2G13090p n=1 Tax=Debaryomyces hansenii (strain ATCC 36239 / CBS 767 / BCRC 21394 / JCM 1990 / NBRC 0083 / IGC 2968) TaxID=284592 RepID=Q6BI64_DEBHA|nr:DEHA2G13090p [Debaryomyces hansenii CBS767]CAG90593.2 DEHA2G13090p [Debaryomyces hansenii CBS767]|eukprot:XP_462107.2 DEHA2G13090p [Debaryomyces hansenii CBS767]